VIFHRMRRPALVVLAGCCLAGCVTPATSPEVYAAKVHLTTSDATSELRTAALASRQWLDGRLTGAYLEVVVVDAETALGGVDAAFTSVQPPDDPDSADLSDRTGNVLSKSTDLVQALRIAVRQGDQAAVRDLVADVEHTADAAEQLAERTS
jgi:hypothetical protein